MWNQGEGLEMQSVPIDLIIIDDGTRIKVLKIENMVRIIWGLQNYKSYNHNIFIWILHFIFI